MEQRSAFNIWLLFIFLGMSFHVVFFFHGMSDIFKIGMWILPAIALLLGQGILNSPSKQSRYPFIVYPVILCITLYLLKNTISPYIHFSLNHFFYFLEPANFQKSLYFSINRMIGINEALSVFSLINITFYISFVFFLLYYLVCSPITTLRRVYNGLFTLIGMLLIIKSLLPVYNSLSFMSLSDNNIFYMTNKLIIINNYITSFNASGFFSSIALYMGLTIFRSNKLFGIVYLFFTFLLCLSLLYFNIERGTDMIIGLFLSIFVFFKVSDGFALNKHSFTYK